MPNFMFVDVSVIEFREFNWKISRRKWDHSLSGHCEINVLHVFYRIIFICFLISLAFNMFFTLMLVEAKLSGI